MISIPMAHIHYRKQPRAKNEKEHWRRFDEMQQRWNRILAWRYVQLPSTPEALRTQHERSRT